MKIEIYIATHKQAEFPKLPEYMPIHVGKTNTDLDLGIKVDDKGDNISYLNESFCELTALYWMWKNSDADILGLCHYRRYFADDTGNVLTKNNLNFSEDKLNIIIAKPEKFFKGERKFLGIKRDIFYSIEEQYSIVHYKKDWDMLKKVVKYKYPEYEKSFNRISKTKKGISFYNMFIANKEVVSQYSEWLFNILFELQKRININDYPPYQKRIFGFMAERLLNVFLEKHRDEINIIYKPVILIE